MPMSVRELAARREGAFRRGQGGGGDDEDQGCPATSARHDPESFAAARGTPRADTGAGSSLGKWGWAASRWAGCGRCARSRPRADARRVSRDTWRTTAPRSLAPGAVAQGNADAAVRPRPRASPPQGS